MPLQELDDLLFKINTKPTRKTREELGISQPKNLMAGGEMFPKSSEPTVLKSRIEEALKGIQKEEEFQPKSEKLFERGKSQIKEGLSQIPEAETFTEKAAAAGQVGKGLLSGIGGAFSSVAEGVIKSAGELGTRVGVKLEQLKGTINEEQAEQTIKEIIEDPDFFNKDEQTKADIFNAAVSFAVPAIGFQKAVNLSNKLAKTAGIAGSGVGAGTLGSVQLEGRLPTKGEAAISAILPVGIQKAPKVAKDVKNALFPEQTADEIVGKISQGKTKDIKPAKDALSKLDTTEINTFDELKNAANSKISTLANNVDAKLIEIMPEKQPIDQFKRFDEVNGNIIESNPLKKAIDDLEELYKKTDDPVALEKIKQFRSNAQSEGLNLKDVNDLAKTYGSEFGRKAFNKEGDPLTGVNAQSFENTRKSLKKVVRQKIPDNATKILDEEMSNLFELQRLSQNMAEKVNNLQQKINQRGLVEKISRSVGRTIDFATFGGIRGFLTSFLPSNIGNKVNNSLDIQQALSKNLKDLDKAIAKESDEGIVSSVSEFIKKFAPTDEQLTRITTKSIVEDDANNKEN